MFTVFPTLSGSPSLLSHTPVNPGGPRSSTATLLCSVAASRFFLMWVMFEAKACSSEAHGAIIHSAAAAVSAVWQHSTRAGASRPWLCAPCMIFEAKVCSSEAHGAIIHSAAVAALLAPSGGGWRRQAGHSAGLGGGGPVAALAVLNRRISRKKFHSKSLCQILVLWIGATNGGEQGGDRVWWLAPPAASLRSITSSGADAFLNG
ncbi:hypothetical protein B0H11DRAFT_1918634 [Mycena galericulata]|nr:hypothetical protein B0H11DRAFT_1918634 [Mycena galericulata]